MTPIAFQTVTPPPAEPVSLAEAKLHLRLENTLEDALVGSLITAARQWAETYTRRWFVQQQVLAVLEEWPCHGEIRIPRGPIQSIDSIKYTDTNGAEQTIDAADYQSDFVSQIGRIRNAYGASWPAVRSDLNPIRITLTVGFAPGDGSPTDYAENIPAPIKQAILLMVGGWYENREHIVAVGTPSVVPETAEHLLWPYRLLEG